MNKKKFLIIIISFVVFVLIFIAMVLFINKRSSEKIRLEAENSKKQTALVNNYVYTPSETIEIENEIQKNNIIDICDSEDCFFDKFANCKTYQYKYNKEKELFFAVFYEENDKCNLAVSLSQNNYLSCNINKAELNKKNFSELLKPSNSNLKYLESIGCSLFK